MKEQERIDTINRIEERIKEKKSLKSKCNELEVLLNDEKLKRYFTLLKEIEDIEEKYKSLNSIEDIIKDEFYWVFNIRNRMDVYPCKHDIWIYEGSYHNFWAFSWSNEFEERTLSENYSCGNLNYSFKYNRYICLECGEKVQTKDWENFEKTHFVLKNTNEDNNLGIEYYRNLYYKLLYTTPIEESQKIVIDEFNSHNEKQNVKSLKK